MAYEIGNTPTSLMPVQEKGQVVKEVTQADTGLGTTFERWALTRYLARLQARTGVTQVFEGPEDGMTGINGLNSIPLGLRGAEVTLAVSHRGRAELAAKVWGMHAPRASLKLINQPLSERLPFADGEFDLAWNFNVMTRAQNPVGLLKEMARISRRYVMVFVPNRANYAFWLHRLHHRVAGDPWDHGRVDLMEPAPWRRLFEQTGLKVEEVVYVDCPWWPDIVDLGQLIADFVPPLKKFAQRAKPENRLRWEADQLPYYRPELNPAVHEQMMRLAYFENSPRLWLKRRFAHHVGLLGVKA